MDYQFSNHALDQMQLRGISEDAVKEILRNPGQRKEEDDLTVFQSIIKSNNEEPFLVRVFVNEKRVPKLIVTVYKTSKIQKYYES